MPPLVSFSTGTPSSKFVQTVCCKRIGLLILILSWWSPLNAMDLCLASLHLGLLLKESLGPGPHLYCRLLQTLKAIATEHRCDPHICLMEMCEQCKNDT